MDILPFRTFIGRGKSHQPIDVMLYIMSTRTLSVLKMAGSVRRLKDRCSREMFHQGLRVSAYDGFYCLASKSTALFVLVSKGKDALYFPPDTYSRCEP